MVAVLSLIKQFTTLTLCSLLMRLIGCLQIRKRKRNTLVEWFTVSVEKEAQKLDIILRKFALRKQCRLCVRFSISFSDKLCSSSRISGLIQGGYASSFIVSGRNNATSGIIQVITAQSIINVVINVFFFICDTSSEEPQDGERSDRVNIHKYKDLIRATRHE